MKLRFLLIAKSVLFSMMLCKLTDLKSYERNFIEPLPGDTIGDLLKKTNQPIHEMLCSIGKIKNSSGIISESGSYILGKNIEGNITIETEDVVLDLNKFQVYSTLDTTTLVTIKGSCKNISIINGTIKGSGDQTSSIPGILVESGASLIEIQNIKLIDLKNGIHFAGTQQAMIEKCYVTNCRFCDCKKAAVLSYTTECIFKHCNALACQESGFELYNSSLNKFEHCAVVGIENSTPDTPICGFSSTEGQSNLFSNCHVEGLSNTVTNSGVNATGFFLGSNEIESQITDCIANQIDCRGKGSTYGIKILASLELLSTYTLDWSGIGGHDLAYSVAWSPNGRHIAYAGQISHNSHSDIIVQVLDATTLIPTATFTLDSKTGNDMAYSVAWSPDGQHIAYAGQISYNSGSHIIVQTLDATTLVPTATFTLNWDTELAAAYSVAWSPDGQSIAYGGFVRNNSDTNIIVQTLDATTLIPTATFILDWAGIGGHDLAHAVAWSPDGKHIAYAGEVRESILTKIDIIVQVLDATTLIPTATFTLDGGTRDTDRAHSIAWSPDGQHITYAGQLTQNSDTNIIVQLLDATTLVPTATYILDWASVEDIDRARSVTWSPDGQHITYAGQLTQNSDTNIIVQLLDATTLVPTATYILDWASGENNDIAYSIAWSPNGKHVAYAGQVTQGSDEDIMVQILNFSSSPALKCSIITNKISNCTSDQTGIGLQGDDSNNLIIKNIAYNNDTNFSALSNIYTGGISGTPGNLQNISLP